MPPLKRNLKRIKAIKTMNKIIIKNRNNIMKKMDKTNKTNIRKMIKIALRIILMAESSKNNLHP